MHLLYINFKSISSSILKDFVAQLVKNPPAMQKTWVQSLGWEDPLEKGKFTHSSTVAWRIPRTTQSMGLQSQAQLSDFHFHFLAREDLHRG